MQARQKQIESLTGLRGVAASWVMLMHFREVTPTRLYQFPIIDSIIANGAYGVDIFFVLSGFVMSYVYAKTFATGWRKSETRRFLIYRFARIYPVHLATFGFMMALFAAHALASGSNGLPGRYGMLTAVSSLTLTNAWIPGVQTPNMPAWSVSAEWFAYLAFPLLCRLASYTRWILVLYVMAGLGIALFDPLENYCLTHVLSGFLLGIVTYRMMPGLRRLNVGRCVGPIIAASIACWAWKPGPPLAVGLLLFATLIPILTNPRDILSQSLSTRPLVHLGEISYSIYMVHWPIRVVLRYSLQLTGWLELIPSPLLVCAYLTATMIFATLSYHYVELPGRTLLRGAVSWHEKRQVSPVALPE